MFPSSVYFINKLIFKFWVFLMDMRRVDTISACYIILLLLLVRSLEPPPASTLTLSETSKLINENQEPIFSFIWEPFIGAASSSRCSFSGACSRAFREKQSTRGILRWCERERVCEVGLTWWILRGVAIKRVFSERRRVDSGALCSTGTGDDGALNHLMTKAKRHHPIKPRGSPLIRAAAREPFTGLWSSQRDPRAHSPFIWGPVVQAPCLAQSASRC